LCDAYGIVAENPLNLPNGFHLAIAKLLAKFDAMPLHESFRHFRRKQLRALRIHSHAGCTRLTLSAGGKKPRMYAKVPSTSLPQHTSCASLVFAEKITSDSF